MRGGSARRLVPWAVACTVVAAVLLSLAIEFRRGGLASAAGIATVVAILPLGLAVLAWARRAAQREMSPTRDQLEQARQSLAGWVRGQWLHEAADRRLHDPDPVAVEWHPTELELGGLTGSLTVGALKFTGSTVDVAELGEGFRKLERHRLVVIGEPGMGKTTLAVLLLLELLKPGVADQGQPVPVLFSLASFDPAQDSVDTWLARKLGQDYPSLREAAFGTGAPAALVRQRLILPVLDGLDEVPDAARPDAIIALNQALADGELGVILTCRTSEFRAAVRSGEVLSSAAVIEPRPVRPADAAAYLESGLGSELRSQWQPVLACLRCQPSGVPLSEALTTPLMLWLVRRVYRDVGRDPADLADPAVFPDAAAIQAHLLDDLVAALIKANSPRPESSDPNQANRPQHAWNTDKALRWLRCLARQLDERDTPDLAWWQLWRAVPSVGLGVAAGLAVAVGSGLSAGLSAGPTPGPVTAGAIVGSAAGLTAGLSIGRVFAGWRRPGRSRWLRMPPRTGQLLARLVSAPGAVLAAGLGAGLTLGLAYGIASGITHGPVSGVKAGLGPALAAAAAAGLGVGFATARGTPPEPARGLRWRITIGRFTAGLTAGLGVGLAVGVQYGLTDGIACGVAGFISIGLPAMLEGAPQRREAVSPLTALNRDRRWALVVAAATGIGVGFVLGLGLPLATGLAVGLATGLSFALLVSMLRTAWPSYELAKAWLAFRGQLPWRLMGFLDDAHGLGLLRQVGSVYQFRHLQLQERLAARHGQR